MNITVFRIKVVIELNADKDKKMKKLIFIYLVLLPLFLISCTSVPYSMWDSSAEKVVDLINHPGEEYLEEISSNPFLFDGELIVLEKDISMIWTNLNRSRFGFRNAVIESSVPVTPDDYALFADTMEVRTFFKKYLPEDASLVKVDSDNGVFYILLGSYRYVTIDKDVDFDRPIELSWFRVGDLKEYLQRKGAKEKFPVIYGFKGPVK